MPRRTRLPLSLVAPEVIILTTVVTLLAALDAHRHAPHDPSERGSVTLEQVAIAAGLLAVAVAAVAVIGKAVTHYTDLLN